MARKNNKCSVRGCDNDANLQFLGKKFCRTCHMSLNFGSKNDSSFWERMDPWKIMDRVGFE